MHTPGTREGQKDRTGARTASEWGGRPEQGWGLSWEVALHMHLRTELETSVGRALHLGTVEPGV